MLDSDTDDRRNKIKVEIKPFSPSEGQAPPTNNNLDDIRKSIEGLRLSPGTNVSAASGSGDEAL